MLSRQREALRRREIAEYLPLTAAQAGEASSRDPAQPSLLEKIKQAAPPVVGGQGQLVSQVFGGKQSATAPATAPVPVAPRQSRTLSADPAADMGFRIPTGAEVKGAAAAAPDFLANMFPFAAGELTYGASRMFGIPEKSAMGARVAAQDFMNPVGRITGMADTKEYKESPTERLTTWIGEHLDKSADWLSKNATDATGIPLSKNDASNIQNVLLLGIGAKKGKGKGAVPEPVKPTTEAPKAAAPEATIATPKPREATPFEQLMREGAQKRAAGTSPLMEQIKQARAMEAGRKEYSIAPETEAFKTGKPNREPVQLELPFGIEEAPKQLELPFGVQEAPRAAEVKPKAPTYPISPEAVLMNDAAKERLRAAEAAEAAKRGERPIGEPEVRLPETPAEVPRVPIAPERRPGIDLLPDRGASALAQKDVGDLSTYNPYIAYSDEPGYDYSKPEGAETKGETSQNFPLKDGAAGTKDEKKTSGFSDEDYQMMGLSLLASPGGMAGNELSQLAQNLGRSGISTLSARKAREQQELDKLYKQAHGEYFKQMGTEAAAKAAYYADAKSEDARRMKVLDAVSESMKSWRTANYGATQQEEQAEVNRLFDLYSQRIGLTPLASTRTSSLFRVLPN
jgi:hypothetical protein